MKYFLIAGEASGDLHGSALMRALTKQDPEAQFAFLGGDMMAEAANGSPVIHYREMAFMGFGEVIRHLPTILGNMRAAKRAIRDFAPDRVILIDYPSFNLKIAKYAHGRGIPVTYYISPKVWAWKEWRVRTIKRVVNQMLCIFPFEVPFYAKHGMEATYVGNPSVAELDAALARVPERAEWLKAHKFPDKPIIALLPGSRVAEIRNNLPLMTAAMDRFPQYRGVVAAAPGIDDALYAKYTRLPIVRNETYALLRHAHAALVTSGTATLETALAGTPQVAMFRNNGSKLTYDIMKRLLKINYVTLPNLIADEAVIPELLQHLCTVDSISDHLGKILPEREARQAQQDGYGRIRQLLGEGDGAERAATAIVCGH